MKSTLVAIGLLVAAAVCASGQQIDVAAVQRWTNAKVVRYHVVGVHEGWTAVSAAQPSNQAQVSDRVTLDFDWDVRANKVVGTPAVVNTKSTVNGLRSSLQSCPPPVLHGSYEHLDATGVAAGAGEPRIAVNGTRTFPNADVADHCPVSLALHPSPGKTQPVLEYLPVPNPMILAVRGANQANLAVTPDGRSFIAKIGDWTWTYTPALVP